MGFFNIIFLITQIFIFASAGYAGWSRIISRPAISIASFSLAAVAVFSPNLVISPAHSDDSIIYKSGKSPFYASKGPKVSDGKESGGKKDIKFLRCISDCKSKCELPSDGLATQRTDCVQDCQDICCESYEQCSYKIKIGSSGAF